MKSILKLPKGICRQQRGQSFVEMAMAIPLLTILVIAIFEFGQAFAAYIALVNATREGAVYASLHPLFSVPPCPPDAGSPLYQDYKNYRDRVKAEAISANLDTALLTIDCPTMSSSTPVLNQPITVTVHYQLTTFTSQMSVPYFERMGRPGYYLINYSMVMPLRYAPP